MADEDLAPSGRLRKSLSLGTAIEASSIVAAVVYAYGWLLISRFLGRFDVGAEEVGLGFSYLTIRAALAVMMFWLVVGLVVFLIGQLAKSNIAISGEIGGDSVLGIGIAVMAGAVFTIFTTTWAAVPVVAGVLSVAMRFVSETLFGATKSLLDEGARWRTRSRLHEDVGADEELSEFDPAPSVPALPPDSGSTQQESTESSKDAGEGFSRRDEIAIKLAPIFRAFSWVFLAVAVVGFLAMPFVIGDRLADRLQSGQEVTPPLLPGVPGLTVRSTSVVLINGEDELFPGCALLLGSAGGVSVFFDPEDDLIVRLPDEQIRVASPCAG